MITRFPTGMGPHAAGGAGFFDYLNPINARDGGVNGVKLTWSEGGTQCEVERGVEVYERVSLTVGRREFVALIGANGAGTSTTLKAASNVLPVERGAVAGGRIAFEGGDVTQLRPDRLVRRGLVLAPEGRRCFRSLTARGDVKAFYLGRGPSAATNTQRVA